MARFGKMLIVGSVVVLGTLAVTGAEALTITPAGPLLLGTTNTTSHLTLDDWATHFLHNPGFSVPTEWYKAESDPPVAEEGSYAGSYVTQFFNDEDDPQEALITHVLGQPSFSCPACYMVVKDGEKGAPAQYLFSLGNWNGTDEIELSGFWPNQGAISYVAIYQGPPISTPEPATFSFLVLGLAGLAVPLRRMRG